MFLYLWYIRLRRASRNGSGSPQRIHNMGGYHGVVDVKVRCCATPASEGEITLKIGRHLKQEEGRNKINDKKKTAKKTEKTGKERKREEYLYHATLLITYIIELYLFHITSI